MQIGHLDPDPAASCVGQHAHANPRSINCRQSYFWEAINGFRALIQVSVVDNLRDAQTNSRMTESSLRSPFDESFPATGVDAAAQKIARTLEKDIVLGRLKPGEKLREEELAERFSA